MSNIKKKTLTVILIMLFAVFNIFGLSFRPVVADTAEQIQKHLDDYAKDLKDAQKELDAEQSKLYQNQTQINATRARINKIKADIAAKEEELNNLTAQAELNKKMLEEYIRQLYYANQEGDSLVKLAVYKGNLSDMVSNTDDIISIKEKINESLEIINDAKLNTEKVKETLADQQADHLQALSAQQNEQAKIADNIEETQATIAELQKKMAELQNDLNTLLGQSYDAKDIKEAIQNAGDETGVREGFLFGMLSVESRLGASVGGCDYKQSRMSSYRLGIFKDIADELGLNYKKLKVSCPPKSYSGTGGAMGAAQFMSDTWLGYKSSIASHTGNNPPNPWNLTDGVMAMALKLKNDGATKSGKTTITSPCNGKKISIKWEVYASMKYLGWSCYGLNNYSQTIQSLSGNYKNL
jgi:peptidoglycan hydrolase CwlO-like protein